MDQMSQTKYPALRMAWAPIGALLIGALLVTWDSLANIPSRILGSWG